MADENRKADVRPVVIRMPVELHEAVKRRAAAEHRSVANAMRHALALYAEEVAAQG